MATMLRCSCADWRKKTIECVPTTLEKEDSIVDLNLIRNTELIPIPRLFSWNQWLTSMYATKVYLYRTVKVNFYANNEDR